jgi:hypothetical protein
LLLSFFDGDNVFLFFDVLNWLSWLESALTSKLSY